MMVSMRIEIHRDQDSTEFWSEIYVGPFPMIVSSKVDSLTAVLELTAAKLSATAGVMTALDLLGTLEDSDNAH